VEERNNGEVNPPVISFLRSSVIALALGVSLVRAQPAGVAPASVPPEVAIARPSAEEVALAEESLRRFVASADAKTKDVLAKYPGLLEVRPPRVNPAVVPSLWIGFRPKHAANVEVARRGDIDLLMMGDSITDFWRNAGPEGVANPPSAGKAVFDRYFGGMKVANFGISGDSTQGVLYRLQNGEGEGFQPKAIMLMIGTNNGSYCSSEEIAEGVGAIVLEMRKRFPAAKILLLGIFPRGEPGDGLRKTVLGVNPIIAKLHDGKHVFYLDIGEKFLAADGTIPDEIMHDKLHPSEKGYEIWAEAVKGPLAELMK
jgi:Lysophospholipase L1 and related esterases